MMNDYGSLIVCAECPAPPFSFMAMGLVAGMMLLLFIQYLNRKGVFRRILKRLGISVK